MFNFRYALRTLFKTPFVTIIAVSSLALGIGANTAIFSLFNQMLLRPLPVSEPGRLVNLSAPGPKPGSQSCNMAGDCEEVFSYPMFRDLERDQTVFTGIAAHRLFGANLASRGQTLNSDGVLVSGSYFPLLGVKPALGRLLGPEDDRSIGQSPVVVLSHAYWQEHFGSETGVLNQALTVNGQVMTIVGVAQRGFDGTTFGIKPKIFVPITMRGFMSPGFNAFEDRRNYWAYLFARLKPGVSLAQARAALDGQYHAIINEVEAPLQLGMSEQTMARFRARTVPLEQSARGQSAIARDAKTPLWMLLGVTAFVLLIACANVANLLLARAAARAGEMTIRLSIGAGRRQLVSQLLMESFMLASIAGCASVLVAHWTLFLIASLLPAKALLALQLGIDGTALAFAAALTLATALLFGLFPALHSTRPNLVSSLKGQAGQASGAESAARFRTALAIAQIALSLTLLVGAGLFTRSMFKISRVDLGLKTDNIVTFGIAPALNGYSAQRSLQLFERMEEELAALPGTTDVTSSVIPLLAGSNWGNDVSVEGYAMGPDTDMNSRLNEIGPAYFHSLGIPLLAGREFTAADAPASPKVAIVNEAFADKFNLGHDAIGKRIGDRNGPQDTMIVGLVKNTKYSEVKQGMLPIYFRPYRQDDRLRGLTFYLRTSLDPGKLLPEVSKAVARIDANLPVQYLRTLPQQVAENIFMDRIISVLATAFAFLATLLAAVGLYGVLAYSVAQRTREIGLRMALGASASRVRRMVIRQVGAMILIGGGIGMAIAVWLGRYAQSMLFQLQGYDPAVLSGSAAALTLVALGAGYVPAQRAARVDPMRALRQE